MTFAEHARIQTRRHFFQSCAGGIGTIALAQLLAAESAPAVNPLAARTSHFPGKAKNVIFLFMAGAPSQMDLFDPKPELMKWNGKSLPPSRTKDLKLAFIKPTATLMGSPRIFKPYGKSGIELSDYLPHTATCVDDICLVRSMFSDAFNHHPGESLLMTGSPLSGRPTMGAWACYGLGSEAQNLPGFVVLSSGTGTSAGSNNWSSGFLPSTYQGVPFRSSGEPILYLANPAGVSVETQRASLDAMRDLNQQHLEQTGNQEIASRIAAYELAFRMQASSPGLIDFSKESPATIEMYGINREASRAYGTNCLLARRMVERGVRFVMLAHSSWDDHENLNKHLKQNCDVTDQPAAALLKDLKQRGLLDSTLVVWGGEFGRTPMNEARSGSKFLGRDHHPRAFTVWMAGGGIKPGVTVGKTDDIGYNIVEDPVSVHDLHATILNRLGFDHTKLTYRFQGRDFRLTDVEGEVIKPLVG